MRLGLGLGIGSHASGAGGGTSVQRYFTTVAAAGLQYWSMDSAVTITGDFIYEFIFATGTTSNQVIISDESSTDFIQIRTLGTELTLRIGGVTSTFATGLIADNKLHTAIFTIVGTNCTLNLDGSDVSTLTCGVGATFEQIGRLGSGAGSQYFNGIIANMKITDAGTPIHEWKLDETDPSSAVDSIGSNDLTGNGLTSADAENFTFDGSVSPNTWTNDDETRVIEVAGT